VRRIFVLAASVGATLLAASHLAAQARVDLNIGFGSAWDKSNNQGIDNANSTNAFGSCAVGTGDTFCQTTSSLNGFFLGFGGDAMITNHFGIGGEANIQPSRSDYGPLQYRQTFYDFNGIYEPYHSRRVSLQLQGGIGGATTSFSINQNSCVGTAVCTSETSPIGSAKHFQEHVGVALQVGLTDHIFVRPQFDYHYVNGLNNQFSSNSVPEATLWVGYTFGGR
jgi:hypothetical protein